MKNRQKTKKQLGKISYFLRSLQYSYKKRQSTDRASVRGHDNDPPHSTKISEHSIHLGKVYRTNKHAKNISRKGMILDKQLQLAS